METTTEELFRKLVELPIDVVAIILSYLPKCMLPHLLYFPPIRNVVATCILSNVKIVPIVSRHSKNYHLQDVCEGCTDGAMPIELSKLKKGIKQWRIYPKTVQLCSLDSFRVIKDTYPLLLAKAQEINGSFDFHEGGDRKIMVESAVKFEHLKLYGFDTYFEEHPDVFPKNVRNLELVGTEIKSFKIEGLNGLRIRNSKPLDEASIATLPDDLKMLECEIHTHGDFNLPRGLHTLGIDGFSNNSNFKLGQLDQLKFLNFSSKLTTKIDDIGLIADNLKSLILSRCTNLMDYQRLRRFNNLEMFAIVEGYYPIDLFNETSFPNMKEFMYSGKSTIFPRPLSRNIKKEGEYLRKISNLELILPPNLEMLGLTNAEDMHINFAKSKFPSSLSVLNLYNVSFRNNHFNLLPSLVHVEIISAAFDIDKDFSLPENATTVSIDAERIRISNLDFLYHLPRKLERFDLAASKKVIMPKLTQKVEWPDTLKELELRRLDIDSEMLEMLNLKNSNIKNIEFYRGKLGKLDLSLFPVDIERLFLERMGITELPESFESLSKLRHLSLRRNYFGRVKSIKLPKLHCLNVNHCDLRFISPFIESMRLEKKVKPLGGESELLVKAMDNWHLNPKDVKKLLNMNKNMTLTVNSFDMGLHSLSNHSSRFLCDREVDGFLILETEYSDFDEDEGYDTSDSLLSPRDYLSDCDCNVNHEEMSDEDEMADNVDNWQDLYDDEEEIEQYYGNYNEDDDDDDDDDGDDGDDDDDEDDLVDFPFFEFMRENNEEFNGGGIRHIGHHVFMESEDEEDDGFAEFGDLGLPPDADGLSVLTALIGIKAMQDNGIPPDLARRAIDSGFLRELVRLELGDRFPGLDDDDDSDEGEDDD